ncbi:MAG: carboxylesterase family protein [Planctomycetota bacterium]|jgi:dienelactone hydrolase
MRAAALVLLLVGLVAAEVPAPTEWLVIPRVDTRGRRPFNPDRIFARYLLDPASPPPQEGGKIGDKAWQRVGVDEKGFVQGRFAYAYAALESPQGRVVLARLRNGGRLYVNGDGFVGDVYGMGHAGVPIQLRKGTNHLYVRGMRGRFRLALIEVAEGLHVPTKDVTLPDLVAEQATRTEGAHVVLNASAEAQYEWCPPLGLRKPGFTMRWTEIPADVEEVEFETGVGKVLQKFKARVCAPDAPRRVTFRSRIDGSVQEYSVLPPAGDRARAAVVLTLHGAGVDAFNQARSYSPKPDFWIVAPTNRRPFGFDWQDWGRRDAYEVLEHFLARAGGGRRPVYLTGHSMGGHGVWHLAANDPDGFVAIAPSAGWCSFDTYAGGRPAGERDDLWRGADGSSLTLDLLANLVQIPTLILHGAKDDNVPLSEAQRMEKALREAGGAPQVHYQPDAGHWWNGDAAQGVDCVDWPGIFELFRKSRKIEDPDLIDFTTADPGVDAVHHWVRIEQPLTYGQPSRVRARRDGAEAKVEVETSNVRRLRLALPEGELRLVIDEQTLTAPGGGTWLSRDGRRWRAAPPVPAEKSPERSGPFKRAFDNRFLFVYGKQDGDGMKRARFDAQVWWYRANGDVVVFSDEEFLAGDFDGRNVILYGNATTNRAFEAVLPASCPVRVQEGSVRVGDDSYAGPNLGCVLVYPRRDDPRALVGVFGHTGPAGARLGYALLPFVSGVGYPDYALFSDAMLAQGDGGVLAAGWFDHAWGLGGPE